VIIREGIYLLANVQKTMRNRKEKLFVRAGAVIGSSFFLLTAILLCALALRVYLIDAKSFWFDESAVSTYALRKSFSELIVPLGFNHPGLFFLILKSVMHFSKNPVMWRYISVFFGVGSVFFTFSIGRILFNKKVGLLSSLLLAVSSLHVFYSQEIGVYALFLFMSLCYVSVLISVVTSKDISLFRYGLFGIVTALLLLSHYFSLIIIFYASLLTVVTLRKETKKKLIGILLIQGTAIGILLMGMIPFGKFFFFHRGFLSLGWIKDVSLVEALLSLITTFSYGGRSFAGDDIEIQLHELGEIPFLAVLQIILIVIGLIVAYRKKGQQRKITWAVFGWLFLPAGIVVFISALFSPLFIVRHLIFSLPAFYILVALGVFALPQRFWQGVLIASLIIFSSVSLQFYYSHELKTPWKKVMHYLDKVSVNNSDIIVLNPYFERSVLYVNTASFERYMQDKSKYFQVISPTMFNKMIRNGVDRVYTILQRKYQPLQSKKVACNEKKRIILIQSRFSRGSSYVFQGRYIFSRFSGRSLSKEQEYGVSPDPTKTREIFKSICKNVSECLIDHEGGLQFITPETEKEPLVITGVYVAIGEINEVL